MFNGLLMKAFSCWLLAVGVATAAYSQQPKGRQHLVNPGDEWSQLAEQLRPGDEILLMPGVHRPAALDDLRGSPERPIVIRSLSVEHMATINAAFGMPNITGGRHGLLMRRIKHVIVRDVIVTGASVHGVEAVGEKLEDINVPHQAPALTIRNVSIERVGPIGRRNALLVRGLDHVLINESSFSGWGGSAIEIVACNDVTVEKCTFKGLPEFSQMNAVQIRAGSERVRVSGCVMIDSGVTGVAMGGTSDPNEFRGRLPDAKRYEASRVRIADNLIRGGHSAVAFINCDQCVVRNNTIIRPERWVYLMLDQTDQRVAPTQRSVFAVNLIQWEPGDVRQFSHLNTGVRATGLTLEQNLWWSTDLAQRRPRLSEPAGSSQFPQVMDVDPQLDERFLPKEPRAAMFGRDTP